MKPTEIIELLYKAMPNNKLISNLEFIKHLIKKHYEK